MGLLWDIWHTYVSTYLYDWSASPESLLSKKKHYSIWGYVLFDWANLYSLKKNYVPTGMH